MSAALAQPSVVSPCSTPGCSGAAVGRAVEEYRFCAPCRDAHSVKRLVVQAQFGKPLPTLLVEMLRFYQKADALAGALGISQVTLYAWVREAFGQRFDDFKRAHLCRLKSCVILSTQGMGKYDVIGKVRESGVCACPIGRERDRRLVLANCSTTRLRDIFPDLDNPGAGVAPHVLGRKVSESP